MYVYLFSCAYIALFIRNKPTFIICKSLIINELGSFKTGEGAVWGCKSCGANDHFRKTEKIKKRKKKIPKIEILKSEKRKK